MSVTEEVVALRALVCGYDETVVVQSTTLSVPPGEILVVAGRSGCGKSTILRTMAGLLPPISGAVEVLGVDLFRADLDERRPALCRMGMMFQGEALLRRYDAAARPAAAAAAVPLPSESLRDRGVYAQLQWGIKPMLVAGVRADYASGDAMANPSVAPVERAGRSR